MSINEALLALICENPSDDSPRLIYADYLEECGDPRGEFIRLQIELSKMSKDDPKYQELQRREQHLLNEHRQKWEPKLGKGIETHVFTRGFVEAITVEPSFSLRRGVALSQCNPLGRLYLSERGTPSGRGSRELPRIDGRKLAALLSVGHFTHLYSGCLIASEGIMAIAESPHLRGLTKLTLNAVRSDPQSINALATLPHLGGVTDLDIWDAGTGVDGQQLGDSIAEAVAASPSWKHLRRVSL